MGEQDKPIERMLDINELSYLSGFKPASLRNAVHLGRHIGKYAVKVGGRLRWPKSAVRRWLAGELGCED